MMKEASWNPLYKKFLNKLSGWKVNTISAGGKLRLCKSVLGGLGVFLFALYNYKVPKIMLKKLKSLRRNFFWGSCSNQPKIPWVTLEKVINSKEKGGLGIRSLKAQIVALLTKWWLRFRVEDRSLWKRVITALHGESGNLGLENRSYGRMGIWDKIATINKATERVNISLNNLFLKTLGSGSNTTF